MVKQVLLFHGAALKYLVPTPRTQLRNRPITTSLIAASSRIPNAVS